VVLKGPIFNAWLNLSTTELFISTVPTEQRGRFFMGVLVTTELFQLSTTDLINFSYVNAQRGRGCWGSLIGSVVMFIL
jgi:hypothetical protein